MKKLVALLLVVSTLFIFASCSMPPKLDLEKAADNLEDEDYFVTYVDDEDKLPAGIVERLYAYGDDDDDDQDYLMILKFETLQSARLYYKQLKLKYKEEITDYKEQIKALKLEIKTAKYELRKFDDDSDWDDDDIDDLKEELEDLREEFKEFKKDSKFGIMGKTVWAGTKGALKDSKG